jgi:hypothetical protein
MGLGWRQPSSCYALDGHLWRGEAYKKGDERIKSPNAIQPVRFRKQERSRSFKEVL